MAGWRVGMVVEMRHVSMQFKVKNNMDSGMFYPVQKEQ
jgi:aspartate/methionine/tyrosine aminotransferase